MANAKLAALATFVVILLHASTRAVAARSSPALSTSKFDSLPATMLLNGFEKGESGGGPAECDEKYHDDDDMLSKSTRPAMMSLNGFKKGESGGGRAECDEKYHDDDDMLVALSTPWYAGGRRCQKMIRITSTENGRTVEARVVDECDTRHGCKDNIVDTSRAVWKALELDTNVGLVPVTWSDA